MRRATHPVAHRAVGRDHQLAQQPWANPRGVELVESPAGDHPAAPPVDHLHDRVVGHQVVIVRGLGPPVVRPANQYPEPGVVGRNGGDHRLRCPATSVVGVVKVHQRLREPIDVAPHREHQAVVRFPPLDLVCALASHPDGLAGASRGDDIEAALPVHIDHPRLGSERRVDRAALQIDQMKGIPGPVPAPEVGLVHCARASQRHRPGPGPSRNPAAGPDLAQQSPRPVEGEDHAPPPVQHREHAVVQHREGTGVQQLSGALAAPTDTSQEGPVRVEHQNVVGPRREEVHAAGTVDPAVDVPLDHSWAGILPELDHRNQGEAATAPAWAQRDDGGLRRFLRRSGAGGPSRQQAGLDRQDGNMGYTYGHVSDAHGRGGMDLRAAAPSSVVSGARAWRRDRLRLDAVRLPTRRFADAHGRGGIRTHAGRCPHDFQSCALSHSATRPAFRHNRGARIRTGDLCDPNAALYRTEPRPVAVGSSPPAYRVAGRGGTSVPSGGGGTRTPKCSRTPHFECGALPIRTTPP